MCSRFMHNTNRETITFFPFNPSFSSVEILNAFYIIAVVVVVGGGAAGGDGLNSRDLKA